MGNLNFADTSQKEDVKIIQLLKNISVLVNFSDLAGVDCVTLLMLEK